ncbi:MAG: aminopeptidase, partial [Ruminococcus sp.]
VKLNILNILFEKYGITESDFISAELEAVPAFKAKDVGFDRSMIGSYGHDDRVCAYTAFRATVDFEGVPKHTAVTVLTDKEETGSDGNTGLCSSYLKYFIEDLSAEYGQDSRTVMSASQCLSADVNAAFDPTYSDVYERNNCAYINKGVCVTKYTGARGKSGTSDASAEFVGTVRNLLDSENVIWQTGELGKVDIGGGGTVAAYIANLNIDTIDVGVPVLSMHAPFEIVSKIDTYMAYRAFSVFIKS